MVVKTDVTGVSLSSTSRTMKKGDTVTLRATVSPGGATYPSVTWKSTDASVATVSQSGKVTAVAEGAAAITAEADGQFAVCAVLVSSEPGDGDGRRPIRSHHPHRRQRHHPSQLAEPGTR